MTRLSIVLPIAIASMFVAGCDTKPAADAPADAAPTATAMADASTATPAPTAAMSGSPTGGTCGGIAGQICASSNDYCEEPVGQCKSTADGQGTCTTKPEVCTREFKPVCGCDDKTYGNACEAAAAGVSVAAEGECKAPTG